MQQNRRRGRLFVVVLVLVLALCIPSTGAEAAETAKITSNADGTVTIEYNNKAGAACKVLVIKDGKQYQYDLKKGKNKVRVPLTLGNGTYSVIICKRVKGNQYAPIKQKNVKLKLNPTRAAFRPTHIIINFKNQNKAIKQAKSLTKKCKNNEQKITTIWKYIVNSYNYDYAKQKRLTGSGVQYIPNVDATFQSKKGICYDIAALYSAMLRSVGIEAKLETGYCKTVSGYHAWNRVYNSQTKKWYVIDCTYDMCKRKQKGKYSMKKAANQYKSIVYLY